MKLDATDLRYITSDEFRVLTAVEMGSKNHEVVPTVLIVQISGLRNGGVNKILGSLAKRNLVARVQNARYDGYRLTYGGYDYLAMRALSKRDSMFSVGNQIGVGKESDVYIVANAEGNEMALKLHRLGRVSFRAIKEKRDYMGKRKSASWMYMSRLAAEKEWAFMKVLYEHQFPVPKPVDHARHCILMEFIDAYPLRQVSDLPSPGKLYSELMDLIVRFAHAGLIHGDFNEFNILIQRDSGRPIVIDFPQMVSTSHLNAESYFNRDVQCIRKFFRKRFRYESNLYPRFSNTRAQGHSGDGDDFRLDIVVSASGFKQRDQEVLEEYMNTATQGSDEEYEEDDDSEDGEEDDGEGDNNSQIEATELGKQEQQDRHRASTRSRSRTPPRTAADGDSQNMVRYNRENSDDDDDVDNVSSGSRALRSPPASRRSSRSPTQSNFLVDRTAAISLSDPSRDVASHSREITERVISEVTKERARQQRKHHSKKGAQRVGGRHKGSKAKMDSRIKVDSGGFWE
ncbi:RIO1-domain-containing protein [Amylocystis lapponica]|nr:RIO1-domain-containing protein [Amylocystis lapponica]